MLTTAIPGTCTRELLSRMLQRLCSAALSMASQLIALHGQAREHDRKMERAPAKTMTVLRVRFPALYFTIFLSQPRIARDRSGVARTVLHRWHGISGLGFRDLLCSTYASEVHTVRTSCRTDSIHKATIPFAVVAA